MSTLIFCRGCQQSLSVDRFFPSWITTATTIARCRSCAAVRAKQWEAANPGYRAAANRKPICRAWRAANKPRLASQVQQWRERNPEQWRAIAKRSRLNNMDKVLFRNRQREILEVTALPPWADRKKIQAIYEGARRLTRSTGIRHEVDHIYPLRGKLCCGLHVESNLRIVTGQANRKKSNKMPEGVAC